MFQYAYTEVSMKTKSIVVMLTASFALIATPAFASGHGQTSLCTDSGAPASHVGQTAHSKVPAKMQGGVVKVNHAGVGGVAPIKTQSGTHEPADSIDAAYRGG
jgi:hypothetical protein